MRKNPALDDATELAVIRTYLAHERTLQAWIRTSASLITFGFSIYKFFEALPAVTHGAGERGLAIFMISVGTAEIVMAIFNYRTTLKTFHEDYGFRRPSFAIKAAAAVAVGGFMVLIVVLLRL
jgi:putative membrane protein